jgi:hypothetical protein
LSASSSSTLSRVEQLDLNREKRENKKRKSFGIIRKIQLFGWQQQHTHTHTHGGASHYPGSYFWESWASGATGRKTRFM